MSAFMDPDIVLTNARLVLPDAVVTGTLAMKGATIVDIGTERSSAAGAVDMEGDYLIPGIVDLHTDNLERQVQPRTLSRWPSRSAPPRPPRRRPGRPATTHRENNHGSPTGHVLGW